MAGLVTLLLASIRVAAWLTISPPFDSRIIPGQVKALLSVGIALPAVPRLQGQLPEFSAPALLASAVEQVVIGAVLGFVTMLFFVAVQAAGDLIDLFGGLSVAFAFDPFSTNQSSIFGRFYHLIALTLLFVTDGWALVYRGFMLSYQAVPLNGTLSLAAADRFITHGLPAMFLAALQIAGPLIAVLFCADVALGLLNRAAPALNVFALGFPAKILLTLSLSGAAIALLPDAVHGLVEQAVHGILEITR
jgi:flagellar biosynthesis protein FliR